MGKAAFLALTCCVLVTAAEKSSEECGKEGEEQIGQYMEKNKAKYGEMPEALGKILKEHDHDKDGHVTRPDIKKLFVTTKIHPDCYESATGVLKHLTDMHDHDKDGKISH